MQTRRKLKIAGLTAADLLRRDFQTKNIPLCKAFDSNLNNGFGLRTITELAGVFLFIVA
jgi:hypothetical protein